mmetsp:Transcript_53711/g.165251  ORF Transcript_53711/g.165251 Transcript_53711/m.165251 type:complete len:247 (-) Transcript_53711:17-757(-)
MNDALHREGQSEIGVAARRGCTATLQKGTRQQRRTFTGCRRPRGVVVEECQEAVAAEVRGVQHARAVGRRVLHRLPAVDAEEAADVLGFADEDVLLVAVVVRDDPVEGHEGEERVDFGLRRQLAVAQHRGVLNKGLRRARACRLLVVVFLVVRLQHEHSWAGHAQGLGDGTDACLAERNERRVVALDEDGGVPRERLEDALVARAERGGGGRQITCGDDGLRLHSGELRRRHAGSFWADARKRFTQ